jgi:hypothetical protein
MYRRLPPPSTQRRSLTRAAIARACGACGLMKLLLPLPPLLLLLLLLQMTASQSC